MTSDKKPNAMNVTLSRDELALVLSLLQVDTLPGLEANPLGELNASQAEMSAVVAARGLRARALARVEPTSGQLLLHVGVLGAVSACTGAEAALFAWHWHGDEPSPQRWYGYRRGQNYVVHQPLEDVLHRFTVLSAGTQLVEEALTVCNIESAGQRALVGELYLKGSDFARVRQLIATGATEEAQSVLAASAASPAVVAALLATLVAGPQISIVQLFTRTTTATPLQQDFTLLQNQYALWLMTPVAGDVERVHIQSITRANLYDLLVREMVK
ncbi:MAG: hypothetical protein ABTQ73_05420 [Caldilineales bacterium]